MAAPMRMASFQPVERSASLCSLPSDEYSSVDENECRWNEKGDPDTFSLATSSSMKQRIKSTSRTPTTSLRMRPSPLSGLHFENALAPSLNMPPSSRRWYETSHESSVHMGKTDSTLGLDFTGDDDDDASSLLYMPKYDATILDTPTSGDLPRHPPAVSPPPFRIVARPIYCDGFEKDGTIHPSLFLPDF